MTIKENYSLKALNTFHIDATAKYFAEVNSIEQLEEITDRYKEQQKFILGGGSNILLTADYNGLIIKNQFKGIKVVSEDAEYVYVRAAAGENWHQLVLFCIDNNYAGIENLSLIPGNVGAAPMQNIGAYGIELKNVFEELEAWDLHDKKTVRFSKAECEFGYRESVFKKSLRNQFCIMNVTLKMNKKHVYNISYGAIQSELDSMGVKDLSLASISQAVINIRSSKLPDPADIGNAGSFFKNPEIDDDKYDELKKKYPDIVGYPLRDQKVKLAAGWLIEKCGWKGFRRGDAGVHEKQALVLVNYGKAEGGEIYNLSKEILSSVESTFDVKLEREVNLL